MALSPIKAKCISSLAFKLLTHSEPKMFSNLLVLLVAIFVSANKHEARIGFGSPAIKGENLDFVALKVFFQHQMQICGGKFTVEVKLLEN